MAAKRWGREGKKTWRGRLTCASLSSAMVLLRRVWSATKNIREALGEFGGDVAVVVGERGRVLI